MHILVILCLLFLSALFSGLNLGLMSLGPHELKRKMELGDRRAARIYPVRKQGNLLLVALLLGNVTVISTLSIFLDSLTPGLVAVVISSLLITVFGEIVPQALFSRYALAFGSYLAPLISIVILVFYPIAKPLAWLLDTWLGEELPELFSRAELIKILEEHRGYEQSDIETDDVRIARGALSFGERKVSEVMTPRSQVKAVHGGSVITTNLIAELVSYGFSRFPVIGRSLDDIKGVLYLRSLVDPSVLGKRVRDVAEPDPILIAERSKLDRVLDAFLASRRHLFIVVNGRKKVSGVISIEDVLEEIINKEIVGEFDKHEDLRALALKASRPLNKK